MENNCRFVQSKIFYQWANKILIYYWNTTGPFFKTQDGISKYDGDGYSCLYQPLTKAHKKLLPLEMENTLHEDTWNEVLTLELGAN